MICVVKTIYTETQKPITIMKYSTNILPKWYQLCSVDGSSITHNDLAYGWNFTTSIHSHYKTRTVSIYLNCVYIFFDIIFKLSKYMNLYYRKFRSFFYLCNKFKFTYDVSHDSWLSSITCFSMLLILYL